MRQQSISEGVRGKINAYKIQKKIVHLGFRGERIWLGKRKCSECNSVKGREGGRVGLVLCAVVSVQSELI